jgi:hypothetical protein
MRTPGFDAEASVPIERYFDTGGQNAPSDALITPAAINIRFLCTLDGECFRQCWADFHDYHKCTRDCETCVFNWTIP